jgi:ribosomal protein S18 acetylase RimI-like enzyme
MLEETPAAHVQTLGLRAVGPEDEAFLLRVYASTRMDEMAMVPWTEEQRAVFVKMQFDAQLHHYQNHFPTATHEIIELAGQSAGRLYVLRTDEFIRILDITLLPEFRAAGAGTRLIHELMSEAAATRRPLRINVESFNPSLRLFERLGFRKAEENGIHFLMEWNSSSNDDRDNSSNHDSSSDHDSSGGPDNSDGGHSSDGAR